MMCPKCGGEMLDGDERQDMVSLFGSEAVCKCNHGDKDDIHIDGATIRRVGGASE